MSEVCALFFNFVVLKKRRRKLFRSKWRQFRCKKFEESFAYNNSTDKFNLKQYEKNIEENLIEKIVEKIIIYLYSI